MTILGADISVPVLCTNDKTRGSRQVNNAPRVTILATLSDIKVAGEKIGTSMCSSKNVDSRLLVRSKRSDFKQESMVNTPLRLRL